MFVDPNQKWNISEDGNNINFSKEFSTGQMRNLLAQKIIDLDTPICKVNYIYGDDFPIHKGKQQIRRMRYFPEFAPADCPVGPDDMFALYKNGAIKRFVKARKLRDFEEYGHSISQKCFVLDITYYPENKNPVRLEDCWSWNWMEIHYRNVRKEKEQEAEEKQRRARYEWEMSRTWWDRTSCGEGFCGWIYNFCWFILMLPFFILVGLANGGFDDLRFGTAANRRDRAYWEWMNKNVR
jgi:hypothetical protein